MNDEEWRHARSEERWGLIEDAVFLFVCVVTAGAGLIAVGLLILEKAGVI